MKKLRLFTGIPLPPHVIQQMHRFIEFHPTPYGLKWTKTDNLHITTCFIGDTPEDNLPDIKQKIYSVAESQKCFELEFHQFQYFPKRRPKMIWGRFHQHALYLELTNQLHAVLGIEKDHKEPIPHVTLARIKAKIDITLRADIFIVPTVQVKHLILWQSVLAREGPSYYELEKFELR